MRYATEADWTDRGAAHCYTVHYPSGQTFTVTGVFTCVFDAGAIVSVMIRLGHEEAVALDPRAVIVRDQLIIFEPRRGPQVAWVRDWLREHPEWPRVVTEAEP